MAKSIFSLILSKDASRDGVLGGGGGFSLPALGRSGRKRTPAAPVGSDVGEVARALRRMRQAGEDREGRTTRGTRIPQEYSSRRFWTGLGLMA